MTADSFPSEVMEFRDPETGRTLWQMTDHGCNCSPYFNSEAWTPESDAFFFLRADAEGDSVMAAEWPSGRLRRLAGPFGCENRVNWSCLKAIPGRRAVTFIQGGAVWVAALDTGKAERIAECPFPTAATSDSDVSGDGRWHVFPQIHLPAKAWKEMAWPPDPFYETYRVVSHIVRIDLNNGDLEVLHEEEACIDHVSVNPREPDLVLYCHEGAQASRNGRMFLLRAGETKARPIRGQLSGDVMVTHERWFPDGERIVYHGHYYRPSLLREPEAGYRPSFVGIFDVARDLPLEYTVEESDRAAWHCAPSPDGRRLVMDQRGGTGGLFYVHLRDAERTCRLEPLTSVASDGEEVGPHAPKQQWAEQDPIWAPDGQKILFRAARKGETNIFVLDARE